MVNNVAQDGTVIVAQDETHRQICRTSGIPYTPDPVRHVYGRSTRRPLEEWFLDELSFFREKYAGYDIFTLGSSLVFGERFVTYLTVCEFDIRTEPDFQNLKKALRSSDQAIRRKFSPLWKWDMAGRKDLSIVFVVGHFDFAYFLLHRQEFRGKAHSLYMKSFVDEATVIKSQDYKVMHDGAIVPFDETKLADEDRLVHENYQRFQFETIAYD